MRWEGIVRLHEMVDNNGCCSDAAWRFAHRIVAEVEVEGDAHNQLTDGSATHGRQGTAE